MRCDYMAAENYGDNVVAEGALQIDGHPWTWSFHTLRSRDVFMKFICTH